MDKQTPKVRNPVGMATIHIVAICYCVYLFFTVLRDYLAGGAEAPSLTTVIVGGIVLLGGACVMGYLTIRLYRQAKRYEARQQLSDSAGEAEEDEPSEEA